MGIDTSFGVAFAKAELGAGTLLPKNGKAFISVRDEDKAAVVPVARRLAGVGFELLATRGTAAHLAGYGLRVEVVNKVTEGSPHVVDAIEAGNVAMVINTPMGHGSRLDSFSIRRRALECRVPYFTTIAGAAAAAEGIDHLLREGLGVNALQDYYRDG